MNSMQLLLRSKSTSWHPSPLGPMHFISPLYKPLRMPLLSTWTIVASISFLRRHKKAINSAPLLVRCTSSSAQQRAIGADMVPEAFGWHAPDFVLFRFLSSEGQVPFPPTTSAWRMRRHTFLPCPVFLRSLEPLLPFPQPCWDLVSDFSP